MQSKIKSLELFHQGKVRDTYIVDDHHFLMITSDRISAFDVIMNQEIKEKGKILSHISNFWFKKTSSIIKNHLTQINPEDVVAFDEKELVKNRSVIVKRLKPVPIEAIVRGYLTGSGWKDYQLTGRICNIELPKGIQQAEKLNEPLFTPSTKANVGDHDENISFEVMSKVIGSDLASLIKKTSINFYKFARNYPFKKKIIIADTKFEFGLDNDGDLVLMDEILTPDSSRFWDMEAYQLGTSPQSFDKQYLRDWLELSGWNKKPPPPNLPEEVIQKTIEKYQYVERLLLS